MSWGLPAISSSDIFHSLFIYPWLRVIHSTVTWLHRSHWLWLDYLRICLHYIWLHGIILTTRYQTGLTWLQHISLWLHCTWLLGYIRLTWLHFTLLTILLQQHSSDLYSTQLHYISDFITIHYTVSHWCLTRSDNKFITFKDWLWLYLKLITNYQTDYVAIISDSDFIIFYYLHIRLIWLHYNWLTDFTNIRLTFKSDDSQYHY